MMIRRSAQRAFFSLLVIACADEPGQLDAGPAPLPPDAGPQRCGSALPDAAADLVELSWDDGAVGTSPYNAFDLSFMGQPYGTAGLVPRQTEHWEAVRFELAHPARVHAIKVRMTGLGDVFEEDEVTLGLYPDFGNNGFDFLRWEPLWAGSRCGEDIRRDEWVTYALQEPLEVPRAGLIYAAHRRLDERSPRWVFAANRSEDCGGWDDCHSAWNFPDLDASSFNGPSFPLPYNYAVRLLVEYTEQADPGAHRFARIEELALSNRSAWADFDEDGWDDVLVNGLKLHRNLGDGRFEDVSAAAGLSGVGGSGVWGDLNNDGCIDLVAFGGQERVFAGDCAGGFSEVTRQTGIDDRENRIRCHGGDWEHASTRAVALFDYNADGLLDIYLANGECWRNDRGFYYTDKVYKNLGDWGFEDVSGRFGFSAVGTYSRAVAPADYDNDGRVDLFVGNYRLQRNYLFHSLGDSVAEVGSQAGVGGDNVRGAFGHAIGAVWTDLNGDPYLDLVIGNLAHPRFYSFSDRSKVLIGSADGTFEDVSEGAGLRYQETHSVPAAADFDQDGNIDLVITAVYPGRPTDFYWGGGDATFRDDAYHSGITTTGGWGAAITDVDNDGDPDLALDRLYINRDGGDGHWLQVRTVGGDGVNGSGIGAVLLVSAGGRTFLRQTSGANGQGGQDSMYLHIGLGTIAQIDSVSVRYPGRAEQVVIEGPIAADQRLWVFADGSHGFGWARPSP